MTKGKVDKNIYLGKNRGGEVMESDNRALKPAAFT